MEKGMVLTVALATMLVLGLSMVSAAREYPTLKYHEAQADSFAKDAKYRNDNSRIGSRNQERIDQYQNLREAREERRRKELQDRNKNYYKETYGSDSTSSRKRYVSTKRIKRIENSGDSVQPLSKIIQASRDQTTQSSQLVSRSKRRGKQVVRRLGAVTSGATGISATRIQKTARVADTKRAPGLDDTAQKQLAVERVKRIY